MVKILVFQANSTVTDLAEGFVAARVKREAVIAGNRFRRAAVGAFGGIRADSRAAAISFTVKNNFRDIFSLAIKKFRNLNQDNTFDSWEKGAMRPSGTFVDHNAKASSDETMTRRISIRGTFLGVSCACEDPKLEALLIGELSLETII